MALRVTTLKNKTAFGHIPTKYRVSSDRAGPQTTLLSKKRSVVWYPR